MQRETTHLLWGVGLALVTHASLFGALAAVGRPTPETRARPPVRIRLIAPEAPKPPPPPPPKPATPEPPKVAVAKAPEPESPRPLKKAEPKPINTPQPEAPPPPSAPPPPPTMAPLEPAPGRGTTGIAIPVAPPQPPLPPAPPKPAPKAITYTAEIGDGTGDGQGDGTGGGSGDGDGSGSGRKTPAKQVDDKPQRGKPVDPASVTKLPGLLRKPGDDELRAAYPEAARQKALDGNVGLEILIDEEGRVKSARVTRPAGNGFDEVALKFIRRHRFRPATKDGQPVTVWIPWLYKFRIGD